jgi:hypothetical protein
MLGEFAGWSETVLRDRWLYAKRLADSRDYTQARARDNPLERLLRDAARRRAIGQPT